jgi:hypothetical protein
MSTSAKNFVRNTWIAAVVVALAISISMPFLLAWGSSYIQPKIENRTGISWLLAPIAADFSSKSVETNVIVGITLWFTVTLMVLFLCHVIRQGKVAKP